MSRLTPRGDTALSVILFVLSLLFVLVMALIGEAR